MLLGTQRNGGSRLAENDVRTIGVDASKTQNEEHALLKTRHQLNYANDCAAPSICHN
jgi:hypothetical protein